MRLFHVALVFLGLASIATAQVDWQQIGIVLGAATITGLAYVNNRRLHSRAIEETFANFNVSAIDPPSNSSSSPLVGLSLLPIPTAGVTLVSPPSSCPCKSLLEVFPQQSCSANNPVPPPMVFEPVATPPENITEAPPQHNSEPAPQNITEAPAQNTTKAMIVQTPSDDLLDLSPGFLERAGLIFNTIPPEGLLDILRRLSAWVGAQMNGATAQYLMDLFTKVWQAASHHGNEIYKVLSKLFVALCGMIGLPPAFMMAIIAIVLYTVAICTKYHFGLGDIIRRVLQLLRWEETQVTLLPHRFVSWSRDAVAWSQNNVWPAASSFGRGTGRAIVGAINFCQPIIVAGLRAVPGIVKPVADYWLLHMLVCQMVTGVLLIALLVVVTAVVGLIIYGLYCFVRQCCIDGYYGSRRLCIDGWSTFCQVNVNVGAHFGWICERIYAFLVWVRRDPLQLLPEIWRMFQLFLGLLWHPIEFVDILPLEWKNGVRQYFAKASETYEGRRKQQQEAEAQSAREAAVAPLNKAMQELKDEIATLKNEIKPLQTAKSQNEQVQELFRQLVHNGACANLQQALATVDAVDKRQELQDHRVKALEIAQEDVKAVTVLARSHTIKIANMEPTWIYFERQRDAALYRSQAKPTSEPSKQERVRPVEKTADSRRPVRPPSRGRNSSPSKTSSSAAQPVTGQLRAIGSAQTQSKTASDSSNSLPVKTESVQPASKAPEKKKAIGTGVDSSAVKGKNEKPIATAPKQKAPSIVVEAPPVKSKVDQSAPIAPQQNAAPTVVKAAPVKSTVDRSAPAASQQKAASTGVKAAPVKSNVGITPPASGKATTVAHASFSSQAAASSAAVKNIAVDQKPLVESKAPVLKPAQAANVSAAKQSFAPTEVSKSIPSAPENFTGIDSNESLYNLGFLEQSYAHLVDERGDGQLDVFKRQFPGDKFKKLMVSGAQYACGVRALFVSFQAQYSHIPQYQALKFEHLVNAAHDYMREHNRYKCEFTDHELKIIMDDALGSATVPLPPGSELDNLFLVIGSYVEGGNGVYSYDYNAEQEGHQNILWLHHDNAKGAAEKRGEDPEKVMDHWSGLAPCDRKKDAAIDESMLYVDTDYSMYPQTSSAYAPEPAPTAGSVPAFMPDPVSMDPYTTISADTDPLSLDSFGMDQFDLDSFSMPFLSMTPPFSNAPALGAASATTAAPFLMSPSIEDSPSMLPSGNDVTPPVVPQHHMHVTGTLAGVANKVSNEPSWDPSPALCETGRYHRACVKYDSSEERQWWLRSFPGADFDLIDVSDESHLSGVRAVWASWQSQFKHVDAYANLTYGHLLEAARDRYKVLGNGYIFGIEDLELILNAAMISCSEILDIWVVGVRREVYDDVDDLVVGNLTDARDDAHVLWIFDRNEVELFESNTTRYMGIGAQSDTLAAPAAPVKIDAAPASIFKGFQNNRDDGKSAFTLESKNTEIVNFADVTKSFPGSANTSPLFGAPSTQTAPTSISKASQVIPFAPLSSEQEMSDAPVFDFSNLNHANPFTSEYGNNVDMSDASSGAQQSAPPSFSGFASTAPQNATNEVDMSDIQQSDPGPNASGLLQSKFGTADLQSVFKEAEVWDNPLVDSSAAPKNPWQGLQPNFIFGSKSSTAGAKPSDTMDVDKVVPGSKKKTAPTGGLGASKYATPAPVAATVDASNSMDVNKPESASKMGFKFDLGPKINTPKSNKGKNSPFGRAASEAEKQDAAARDILGLDFDFEDDKKTKMTPLQQKKDDLQGQLGGKPANSMGDSKWASKKQSHVQVSATPEKKSAALDARQQAEVDAVMANIKAMYPKTDLVDVVRQPLPEFSFGTGPSAATTTLPPPDAGSPAWLPPPPPPPPKSSPTCSVLEDSITVVPKGQLDSVPESPGKERKKLVPKLKKGDPLPVRVTTTGGPEPVPEDRSILGSRGPAPLAGTNSAFTSYRSTVADNTKVSAKAPVKGFGTGSGSIFDGVPKTVLPKGFAFTQTVGTGSSAKKNDHFGPEWNELDGDEEDTSDLRDREWKLHQDKRRQNARSKVPKRVTPEEKVLAQIQDRMMAKPGRMFKERVVERERDESLEQMKRDFFKETGMTFEEYDAKEEEKKRKEGLGKK